MYAADADLSKMPFTDTMQPNPLYRGGGQYGNTPSWRMPQQQGSQGGMVSQQGWPTMSPRQQRPAYNPQQWYARSTYDPRGGQLQDSLYRRNAVAQSNRDEEFATAKHRADVTEQKYREQVARRGMSVDPAAENIRSLIQRQQLMNQYQQLRRPGGQGGFGGQQPSNPYQQTFGQSFQPNQWAY